jgi:glyoxylase-like metal-dependent hydrolase (beta-lactamase superfamily II)
MSIRREADGIDYPPLDLPEGAQATQIVPGLLWIRHRVPGSLNHINLWLLDEGDAWTLIDTGMNLPETRAGWELLFDAALRGRPIRRLIVTHNHPDHFGLAHWLVERHGALLWMTRAEHAIIDRFMNARDELNEVRRDGIFTMFGMERSAESERLANGIGFRGVFSGVPVPDHFPVDGDVIDIAGHRWRAIVHGGHADEQLMLHDSARGLLISADQVLPRISSNIGIFPGRAPEDPLSDYLASLAKLGRLPEDTLVLPSHGRVFRGLRARTAALAVHHAGFLDRMVATSDRPLTASELSMLLFPQHLDATNRFMATAETLAHARYLTRRGRLERIRDAAGHDRYVRGG